jgi:hypothetical protein
LLADKHFERNSSRLNRLAPLPLLFEAILVRHVLMAN